MSNNSSPESPEAFAPLAGVRVLSLALNLPGPAALMRCRAMGATCTKLEPPSGDPMGHYNPTAYAALHEGVAVEVADLKTEAGQQHLHAALENTDVLLTSFRPSALAKLGLAWTTLHARHPRLSQVAIVGAPGERAEEPGHDLTYLAEAGLVTGTELPPTLYADMGGALLASEAVLKSALRAGGPHAPGICLEVALNAAADWLALPHTWGLTKPTGAVGGAHAGYRVYRCADGRVAVAALEPHFAARLSEAAGLPASSDMAAAETHQAITRWIGSRTRADLETMARERDVPLLTLGD